MRRLMPDTRMIVIKDERTRIVVVACAVNAKVAGTEITVRNIFRQRAFIRLNRLTTPRTVLPVSGNDYPLLT